MNNHDKPHAEQPPASALKAWATINTIAYMQADGIPQAFWDYYHGTWATLADFINTTCDDEPSDIPNRGSRDVEVSLRAELAPHYRIITSPEGIHLFHRTN